MKTLKINKMNRKQKNLLLLLLVVVIVIVIVLIVVKKNTITTLDQDFHITDIESITKLVIKDKENNTLVLTKQKDSTWLVNNKYEANSILTKNILETFRDMRIREPLPKAARNNVVKDLATVGKTVEVYTTDYKINIGFIKLFKGEHLKCTYFVGTETSDEMGTYMLKKGDNIPYIIYIPNFRGYLSSRFSAIEDLWRAHKLFSYKQKEIESIKVELPTQPSENYTLVNNGKGFSFVMANGETLPAFDTNKVVAFLSSFVDMNYERIAKNISQIEKDTIFSKPPSFVITLKDKKGKENTLKTYVKMNDPNSIAQDDNDFYQIFDINRCYALSNKFNDTLVIQFFTLDNVLKPASYFFIGAEGKPYIK